MAESQNIDLNAARAARHEGEKKGPTATLGEETFQLPAEMPFAVLEAVGTLADAQETNDGMTAAKAISTIARALFRERYADFMAQEPEVGDIMALLSEVVPKYGVSLGESEASGS